jgi:hypothetical protein
MPKPVVNTFNRPQELDDEMTTEGKQEYCLAIYFEKLDLENFEY